MTDAGGAVDGGAIRFEIPFTGPLQAHALMRALAVHALDGVEHVDVTAKRVRRLVQGRTRPVPATVVVGTEAVEVEIDDAGPGDREVVETLVRRWFDLDLDPARVTAVLGRDPVVGSLVAARPGLRVLGHPDPFEAAVTTVLGQRVSLSAARRFGARLVAAYGEPGPGGLMAFPTAERLAVADPTELQAAVGVTHARARTLCVLAEACAVGLDLGGTEGASSRHAALRAQLLAIPGIGPWTVEYLAVRVLGDRDAFPAGDLVLQRALGVRTASQAELMSAAWSPLRAYALFHLWTSTSYL